MARVLFYTGASILAISATLLYLPTYFSFIIALIVFVILILLIILRKKIVVNGLKTLLLILLIFTLLGLHTYSAKIKPAEKMIGFNAEIIGTVCEYPTHYDTYSVYFLKTEQITLISEEGKPSPPTNIPQKLKIRLSDINEIGANVFDKLRLTVQFNDLDIYRNSSLADKVYAGGYIISLDESLGKNRPFYAIFYDLREWLNDRLFDNMYFDDAAVVSAILLGDRSNLNPEFESDAKTAGITHMLVVSGMHLGIIYGLLIKIFSALKIGRIKTNLLILGAIFSMTAICGFTPSILRAALTYVIIIIGNLIFKKPDSLNSLGAATVILLFFNPLGFGNISLLLSLLSTFGLLFICPILVDTFTSLVSKIIKPGKFAKGIIFSLSQSLSATIATMPVCIIYLGYISLIAPVTNLLTGYAASLLTSFSFIGVALISLPSILKASATLPLFVIYTLVRYIVKITAICADIDFASIPARKEYLISFAILIISIPLLILAKKSNKKATVRISLKLCASAMVLLSVSSAVFFYDISPKTQITIPNVGKGASILIKTETDVFAIGAGDSLTDYNKIENFMVKMCKQDIDHIIIPTANKTFAAGTPEMVFQNPEANVIYPKTGDYTEKLDYISNQNFKSFDYKISFTSGNTEIITIADIGTIVNFIDHTMVIYTGTGDINTLFSHCKYENPILICANNLIQNIEHTVSHCVIIGSDEAKTAIEEALKTQNINYITLGTKAYTIEF
ncbi:MAG: ComEC/Rec2 family competence protein [Ruminococcaceae bacterium]|nr:ComEC/Rec2 family competence protein [Oscillospiraceae bacterium]